MDTDGDLLLDGTEINDYGCDPTMADTDGDGLDDGAEVTIHNTIPTDIDTDDDGLTDYQETDVFGSNPQLQIVMVMAYQTWMKSSPTLPTRRC